LLIVNWYVLNKKTLKRPKGKMVPRR